jgi:trehalose 6-phosphate phosphatase
VTHAWCALLLDYDGTLAPLVADPATACMSPAMRRVLTALRQHPRYRVAIVSGRALADLRARVDGTAQYLAGNHGLEMLGPDSTYCHPRAHRLRPRLAALAQVLRQDLADIPGAWVEDKSLTLSVHCRDIPARFVPLVRRRVLRRVCPALEARELALRTGKAVVEVRPRLHWGKVDAVRWLVEHMRLGLPVADGLTVYIGDDETDEDAFHTLHTTGLGIVVGGNRLCSAAHYCVESVDQTLQFLALLRAVVWPGCASASQAVSEGTPLAPWEERP